MRWGSPVCERRRLSDVPYLGDVFWVEQSQAARLQRAAVVGQSVIDLAEDGSCAVSPGAAEAGRPISLFANRPFLLMYA